MKTSRLSAISYLLSAICCLALLTGCAGISPQAMGDAAELAAFNGGTAHLINNPDDVEKFQQTIINLDGLIATTNYHALAFADAMKPLGLRSLEDPLDPKTALIIGNTMFLWDRYKRQITPLNTAELIGPVAIGTRNGLSQAAAPFQTK